MNLTSDSGGIVLGWLTRLALVLSLVGLVAFDGIAVVQARVGAQDRAEAAARAGAEATQATPTAQVAFDAAALELQGGNDVIDEVTLLPDGSVTVRVSRTAPTLLVDRIGPIRDWAAVEATATASSGR